MLPPDELTANLVLAVADGTPRNPFPRQRRHPLRSIAHTARMLFGHKIGAAFAVLLAVLVAGFVLLLTVGGFTPANALYLTLLDAAVPRSPARGWRRRRRSRNSCLPSTASLSCR